MPSDNVHAKTLSGRHIVLIIMNKKAAKNKCLTLNLVVEDHRYTTRPKKKNPRQDRELNSYFTFPGQHCRLCACTELPLWRDNSLYLACSVCV